MATTELLFYGAGGHAKVVIESWLAAGGRVAAIFDDNTSKTTLIGYKVSGKYISPMASTSQLVITVGNNRTRMKLASMVGHPFGTVVHPSVVCSPSATIGEGTVLLAGSIVAASTVIGKHAIINHRASVDHDCHIGDLVHIAPGCTVCGEVTVGEGTTLGAGSTVLPGVTIGQWATIGAGSVITRAVPDFAVVTGVPGKVSRYNEF